jgi:hypothetical protein
MKLQKLAFPYIVFVVYTVTTAIVSLFKLHTSEDGLRLTRSSFSIITPMM